MNFIIDAQLPPALAVVMNERGFEARHVQVVGLRDSDDSAIWSYALENQSVIVTKDEDFGARVRQSKVAPVVVWLRIGNCSRTALLDWFLPILPGIIKEIEQGHRLIEVK